MAHPLWIEKPGAYYHVVNREKNQEKISKTKVERFRVQRSGLKNTLST